MALRKEEERRQLQARTGGGVLSLIFKRGKTSMGTGSLSSENRSISPSHSDDSRSITPPAVQQQILTKKSQEPSEKPRPPQRKRRLAPKPPQQVEEQRKLSTDKPASQISTTSDVSETDSQQRKSDSGLTICHSRNSSDSSGYHEPSVLSDHCNTSLPRRPKSTINEVVNEEVIPERKSKLSGNLSNMSTFSQSTASIASRKKKAAPPPPPPVVTKAEPPAKASPTVDASTTPTLEKQEFKSHQNTSKPNVSSQGSISLPHISHEEQAETVATSPSEVHGHRGSQGTGSTANLNSTVVDESHCASSHSSTKIDNCVINNVDTSPSNTLAFNSESAISYNNRDIETPHNDVKQPVPPHANNIPNIPIEQVETDLVKHQSIDKVQEDLDEIDWAYQIPPPPTEFRDTSPTNDNTQQEVQDLTVATPDVLNKTKTVDCDSIISDDTKPMLNTLTLESLEKRKSLVYNREISTSLKVAQENSNNCNVVANDIDSKRSSMLNELEEVIQNGCSKSLSRHVEQPVVDSYLPNFKISSYAEPKTNINIFEDDSIRSKNSDVVKTDDSVFKKPFEFNKHKTTSRNNFYVKHHNSNNLTRSESFSSNNMIDWKPQNPVQRSKSQLALNKALDGKEIKTEENSLTKSNSLFDVSGLQSLEVMRVIQTKLNTPSNSTEQLLEEPKKYPSASSSTIPKREDVNVSLPPKIAESESTTNTKTYHYRGPPAINLSTWSERPKTKISLKEDTDYRISNKTTVKVNGIESKESGNVLIKIEAQSNQPKDEFSSRFVNHTSSVGYRKPLANINKIEKPARPHSVAFDTDFDISRVPIVRAVELKKSVTQIINDNNRFADAYSSEVVNNITNHHRNIEVKPVQRVNSFAQNRPNVMGFRSIEVGNDNTARSRKSWNVPNSYTTLPSKKSIAESSVKSCNYTPNSNVPFSQLTLKHVESSRMSNGCTNGHSNEASRNIPETTNHRFSTGSQFVLKNSLYETQPTPPPMPLVTHSIKKPLSCNQNLGDPRDELLNSIRNFGGLKGLRHVKV